jgi:hypothetical protein
MPLIKVSKRLLVITFVFFAVAKTTFSQSTSTDKREYISNKMIWMSLGLQGKIKNNFSYQFDLEYRRQADPMHAPEPNDTVGGSHNNFFRNPYQFAARPWVLYQPNKNIVFAISPITWFGTWSAPVNGITSFQPELRSSFQVTLNNNIGRVSFNNRYRYEMRYFGTKEVVDDFSNPFGASSSYSFPKSNRQGRVRYMLRITVPINNEVIEKGTYYGIFSSEILLRTGKNVSNSNLVDQYRIYGGLGYKFSENMRVELGYLNAVAFRLNNAAKNNVDVNNVIWIKLIIDNFNNLFRKQKSENKYIPNDD